MPSTIAIVMDAPIWRTAPPVRRLARTAIAATLARAGARIDGELTLLLCDDARIRELNSDFRGFDRPTNVLSFPGAQGSGVAGDIAVAFETLQREAREEGKSFADHFAHLVTHGVLHILGYDHAANAEAEEMEAMERDILARMNIADPYAPRRRRARL